MLLQGLLLLHVLLLLHLTCLFWLLLRFLACFWWGSGGRHRLCATTHARLAGVNLDGLTHCCAHVQAQAQAHKHTW